MIAYAMLYTVVAGVPILLAALALSSVLRKYGRAERGVWVAALLLAFAIPAISLARPFGNEPTASAPTAPEIGVIGLPTVLAVPVEQSTYDLGWLLFLAWLTTSAVLALRWAVASRRLARAARAWHPSTIDGVPVWMTQDAGPAVSGVLRPRVLVPAWVDTLPSRQRSLIMLHEQEHIRARDPLVIALTRWATILAPWNPVVWALASRLVRAVELDCDRRVLRQSADVAAYGHALLTVSSRRPSRLVLAAAFAESEAPLRTRILSMTTPPKTVSIVSIVVSTMLGAVLLVAACGVPVPTADDNPGAVPDQTPTVTAFDAPPTPPPAPRPARDLAEAWAAEPGFTPMTVRPSLVNAPEVQQALIREYPALLRDAGIGGAPVLWIHIDRSGLVDDVRVYETSGYQPLDEAAMNVARAMRFSPAYNGDQVVRAWVQIPIRFRVAN